MTVSVGALVTATYGRRVELRKEDGEVVSARMKGRNLKPVCGDRVTAEAIPNEPDWLVTGIDTRRNELTRPNMRGKIEILAANLDLVAVTCAPMPRTDWFIADRYLCAAELMNIVALVVFNKSDTGTPEEDDAAELARYRALGYATPVCSAKTGQNLDQLAALLADRTAIIVGQSGVGKSSLINVLTEAELRTAEISDARGEGRHTTVNSVMLPLPGGGQVVDSPGVRDYAPAIDSPADVEFGFREIHEYGRGCRFNNCRHRQEPGCAVLAGLAGGDIHPRRYESYKRMLLLTEQRERY